MPEAPKLIDEFRELATEAVDKAKKLFREIFEQIILTSDTELQQYLEQKQKEVSALNRYFGNTRLVPLLERLENRAILESEFAERKKPSSNLRQEYRHLLRDEVRKVVKESNEDIRRAAASIGTWIGDTQIRFERILALIESDKHLFIEEDDDWAIG